MDIADVYVMLSDFIACIDLHNHHYNQCTERFYYHKDLPCATIL